ncbi:hypothetical protein [Pseudomonas paralcaligenes]|uniref:hypothetical protein n=1 Tax=Pseudomonas paralcaligenes TaxID=2772558 RepID=UPI001C7FA3D5|nr:hypothetical protein [Pseudomonas paralcaligenes]
MRIDQDDIPEYIRARKPSPWSPLFSIAKWSIAGLFGIGITAGALYFADGNMAQLAKLSRIEPNTAKPTPAVPPESNTERYYEDWTPPEKTAEDLFWEDQGNSEKQTVYNDSNYRPKNPVNVVSTEGIRESNAYQQRSAQQTKTVHPRVERDGKWIDRWGGGGSYYAKWKTTNNYIDGGTVCSNHKRGSIDYRECRKGAKQYFHEQCRVWRDRYDSDRENHSHRMRQRYCSAASSFSPMG